MSAPATRPPTAAPDDVVLGLSRTLARELYPERGDALERLGMDASLEHDFGFDSLSRAELLGRVETSVEVTLTDATLAEARTPRELARAAALAQTSGQTSGQTGAPLGSPGLAPTSIPSPASERDSGPDRVRPSGSEDALSAATSPGISLDGPATEPLDPNVPHESTTLVEALERHAHHAPGRVHTTFLDEQLGTDELTYGVLRDRARSIAQGLWALGVEPGDKVALMLPSDRSYFTAFMGVLRAGATPVPIYPPVRPNQLESHLRRHAKILDNAGVSALITVSAGKLISNVLAANVPSLHCVTTIEAIDRAAGQASFSAEVELRPDDLALIQYTSGSTGDPKGVTLTHAQLLANIRAMGTGIGIGEDDVFVSWLPLYHDMGLIGAWLGGSMCFGAHLVLMSPLTFLRRPVSWLEAIHRFAGSLSAAPNFAYQMAVHRIADEALEGIDLSSWRLAFNGAEPVSAPVMSAFTERYVAHGFRPEAMAPVFGLAECALGLTFPPLGRGPLLDVIDQDHFARTREARALPGHGDRGRPRSPGAEATTPRPLTVVACGRPLAGYEVRIADDAGSALADRREGRVQFRGPSATEGYYRNPTANQALFDDGWVETGDLGYLVDQELYITRRVKDMIIRAGRNLFPYELEDAVGDLDGVRKGCVAVFASTDPGSSAERVVVLAEVGPGSHVDESQLRADIQARATEIFGLPADDIVLAPPNSVLKTSSGKIRRSACRERYERGEIGASTAPVWVQFVRVTLAGLPARIARLTGRAGRALWGLWTWIALAGVALAAYPAIAFGSPAKSWRRARRAVWIATTLAGCRPEVRGTPDDSATLTGGGVLVANHASYMDWLIVLAAVPRPFGFVAKGELADVPLIGRLLRNLGTEFVDRFDPRRSIEDAARFSAAVREGRWLMVFPEGTFRRAPGLAPFRLGAFQAAAQAGAPVVPIRLQGTRAMLPDGTWLPAPGPTRASVLAAIEPTGDDWSAALTLRDKARDAIAEGLDEPRLSFSIWPGSTG